MGVRPLLEQRTTCRPSKDTLFPGKASLPPPQDPIEEQGMLFALEDRLESQTQRAPAVAEGRYQSRRHREDPLRTPYSGSTRMSIDVA